jgi:serine/threonine protein kinase
LCYQLIKGLSDIHKNRVCHRDIRPHNIYYSLDKKGYVIASFSNAISAAKIVKNSGVNLAGVPYYLPSYLYQVGKK